MLQNIVIQKVLKQAASLSLPANCELKPNSILRLL